MSSPSTIQMPGYTGGLVNTPLFKHDEIRCHLTLSLPITVSIHSTYSLGSAFCMSPPQPCCRRENPFSYSSHAAVAETHSDQLENDTGAAATWGVDKQKTQPYAYPSAPPRPPEKPHPLAFHTTILGVISGSHLRSDHPGHPVVPIRQPGAGFRRHLQHRCLRIHLGDIGFKQVHVEIQVWQ